MARWIWIGLALLVVLGSALAIPRWYAERVKVVSYDLDGPSVTIVTPAGRQITLYGRTAEEILKIKRIIKPTPPPTKTIVTTPQKNETNSATDTNTITKPTIPKMPTQPSRIPRTISRPNQDLEARVAALEERVSALEAKVDNILGFLRAIAEALRRFFGF